MAGVDKPGDLLLKFGGSGDIMLSTDRPRPDSRLFLDYHIVPDRFMPNGCMASSGSALNWIAREFGGGAAGDTSVHAALDARASEIAPASDRLVLLPYFVGEKTPIHDPSARGTLVGLDLSHSLVHIWRAALEAVCLGFRHHITVMSDVGYPIERLLASDGGTASHLWMQIAADVMQRPIQVADSDPGSALGAAYVAGKACGLIDSWSEADRFMGPRRVVEPDPAHAGAYARAFDHYLEVYDRLATFYPDLQENPAPRQSG
jgi:xylulokinase